MAKKPLRPGRLELQLTYPQTNQPHPKADKSGRFVSLRIRDDTSGQIIAEVDLSGEELMHLLGTMSVTTDAEIGTRLDRVGKRLEISTVQLGYVSATDPEAWQAKVDAAAAEYTDAWEVVEGRRHNTGTMLHLARWVDVDEEK